MTADEFEMDLHYRHFRSGSKRIWDNSEITDVEKDTLLRLIEVILP